MGIMNSISDRRIVLYSTIIIICIVVVGVAVYFQFFQTSDKSSRGTNTDRAASAQEAEYERIKTGFNLSFTNSVRKDYGEEYDIVKEDETKDIVYTMYQIDIYSENKYDINLNLPVINIDNPVAKEINEEIDEIFGSKANSVVQSKETLSIYNLDYIAYLKDDILSLIIKATLKEQEYPQRVIIKTYNYNVVTNQKVSLGSMLLKKNLDKNEVYNKVISEIETISMQNEALSEIGYEVFKRNIHNKMYLPENTDTFFMDQNDYLYLIYAYGNNNFTSEMDMIIF